MLSVFAVMSYGEVYKKNVTVSYYAEDFHGKKTSSGEVFNMNDYTCAHVSLPFGTILKVTNRANGKSVSVRVNDRGPFVIDREADLSKAAAVKLDMIKSGTAKVDIEIEKSVSHSKISLQTAQKAESIMMSRYPSYASSKQSSATQKKNVQTVTIKSESNNFDYSKLAKNTYWDIQTASFSSKANAQVFAQKLYDDGFRNIAFQKTDTSYRVVLKDIPWTDVQKIEKRLKEKGYNDLLIRQRR